MSEPSNNPLPPRSQPVLEGVESPLTIAWYKALQQQRQNAQGGITQLTGDVLAGPGGGVQIAELSDTGVIPGTYANADIRVNAQGRVLEVSNGSATEGSDFDPLVLAALGLLDGYLTVMAAYTLARPRTFSYTGDATGGPTTFDGSADVSTGLTLATVNSDVGTFGDATDVGQFTVNAKGLITAASNVPIALAFTDLTDVPGSYSGQAGNLVAVKATEDGLEFIAPPSGAGTVTSVDISSTNLTVGGGPITGAGTLTVALPTTAVTPGSYTSANITVDAEGRLTAAASGSGGGTPGGSSGQIQYNNAGAFGGFTASGDATINTSTGAVSVVQAPKWTTGRTLSITGDLAYTSPSIDGTGNVTAAGTLATVNSNIGTFGDATHVGVFTVNAKGLITAATSVAITGGGGGGSTTITTTAGQTSISFTPPTSGFAHLRFIINGRSVAATTSDNLAISFNGDTTNANYNSQQGQANSTSATAAAFTGPSNGIFARLIGDIPAATGTANRAGSVDLLVPAYLGTTFVKNWQSLTGQAAFPIAKFLSGNWNSTAALTSVTIVTTSGSAFVAGTTATMLPF